MNSLLKSALASALITGLGSTAVLASEAANAPAPETAAAVEQVAPAPAPEQTAAAVPLSPWKGEAAPAAPAPEQTAAAIDEAAPAAAAPEESVAAEEPAKPAVLGAPRLDRTGYRALHRARAEQMRAAQMARIAMMEESSNRFRDWAENSSMYMDPWGQSIEAYTELHRRMMDPWGAQITDAMDQQFEDRLAMRGYPHRPIKRHEAAKDWARLQQAAIYDNARRFHQAWISNLPRVQVAAPVAYAPYWPVAPYAIAPVAVAAEK